MRKTQTFRGMSIPVIQGYKPEQGPFRGNYGAIIIYLSAGQPPQRKAIKVIYPYIDQTLVLDEGGKQRKVTSTYVVSITDVHKEKPYYIDMAYYPNRLDDLLRKAFSTPPGKLSFTKTAPLLWGICQGINDAHDLPEADGGPIIHGDIKPANVLLDDNLMPKISDFGASRSLTQKFRMVRGSTNWMAPELLCEGHTDHTQKPTKECDYFSFGVLAYVMLTSTHPFHYDNPSGLFSEEDNIKNSSFVLIRPNQQSVDAPPDICDQVMLLLSRNPRDRVQAFKNLKITLSRYSQAILEPPDRPTTPVTKPAIIPETQVIETRSLSPDSMLLINTAYDNAKRLFFREFNPAAAVDELNSVLSAIHWNEYKESNSAALADCWSLIAFIKNSNGRYDEAIQASTNGLMVDNRHVNSLHSRAYAYGQKGRDDEAIEDLQQALSLTNDATKQAQIRRLLEAIQNRIKGRGASIQ